jgi:parallel beta-helix repeat protein
MLNSMTTHTRDDEGISAMNWLRQGIGLHRILAVLLAAALLLSGLLPWLDEPLGQVTQAAGECNAYASPTGNDDTGTGSIDKPVQTIRTLALKLQAGETGCLMAGQTFFQPANGYGVLPTGLKGTAQQPITIRSSPGGWATYTGVLQVDASNVVITGISFGGRGALPNPKNPHILIFGDRVTLERNVITTPKGICIQIGDASLGEQDQAVDVKILNNRIFGCGLQNLTDGEITPATDSGSHGIYIQNTLRATIEDNYIYDNAVRGVQLWPSAEQTSIRRNILHNNSTNLTIGSCWGGACLNTVGRVQSQNTRVHDNVISDANFQFYPDDASQVNGDFAAGSPTAGNDVTGNCIWHPDPTVRNGTNGTFRLFGGNGYDYGQATNPVHGNNTLANPQYVDAGAADHGAKDLRVGAGSGCAGMGPATEPPSLSADPAPNLAPTISNPTPADSAVISERQPRIAAWVRDEQTALQEANIQLFLDGTEVGIDHRGYSAQNELFHTPEAPLALGQHRVNVVVTDGQLSAEAQWSFTITDGVPPVILTPTPTPPIDDRQQPSSRSVKKCKKIENKQKRKKCLARVKQSASAQVAGTESASGNASKSKHESNGKKQGQGKHDHKRNHGSKGRRH